MNEWQAVAGIIAYQWLGTVLIALRLPPLGAWYTWLLWAAVGLYAVSATWLSILLLLHSPLFFVALFAPSLAFGVFLRSGWRSESAS